MTAPYWLSPQYPELFPDVELALTEPNGLLAVGGDLSVDRLLAAYRHGIFPWYSDDQPILWWSPHPRSVLFPDDLKISRSLRKTLKKEKYHVTFDIAFGDVIAGCAAPRGDGMGTWITQEMQEAYQRLYDAGHAHSVESWYQGKLVGGLYGVALGKVFFGESMFALMTDASKVAFVVLTAHLKQWGFKLVDCQVETEHLNSLGARNIPRQRFIDYLKAYCEYGTPPEHWKTGPELLRLLKQTGRIELSELEIRANSDE